MTPTVVLEQTDATEQAKWTLPDPGRVGVLCLIVTEFTIFSIFVVAYVFYNRQESLGSHTQPGFGIADLGNDLLVVEQHHRWNRGTRAEGQPISTIQTVDRRDHPPGPRIPAQYGNRVAPPD